MTTNSMWNNISRPATMVTNVYKFSNMDFSGLLGGVFLAGSYSSMYFFGTEDRISEASVILAEILFALFMHTLDIYFTLFITIHGLLTIIASNQIPHQELLFYYFFIWCNIIGQHQQQINTGRNEWMSTYRSKKRIVKITKSRDDWIPSYCIIWT